MKQFNRNEWVEKNCLFVGPMSERIFCTGCPYLVMDNAGRSKCDPKTEYRKQCGVPLFDKPFWERRNGVQ